MSMDDLHSRFKPLQRSLGRSSVAAAAYAAGLRLEDERQGMVFDYTKKELVHHHQLINPKGEILDPESFWNAVERKHLRGDAVPGRTMEYSLPDDLPPETRLRIAEEVARAVAATYGVGVHYAVHTCRGQENPHVHMVMSSCAVLDDGSLGKKVAELDPIACQRSGAEPPADYMRALVATASNRALAEQGIGRKIETLSFADRNIDKIATRHEGFGPDREARAEVNRLIKITNAERAEESRQPSMEKLVHHEQGGREGMAHPDGPPAIVVEPQQVRQPAPTVNPAPRQEVRPEVQKPAPAASPAPRQEEPDPQLYADFLDRHWPQKPGFSQTVLSQAEEFNTLTRAYESKAIPRAKYQGKVIKLDAEITTTKKKALGIFEKAILRVNPGDQEAPRGAREMLGKVLHRLGVYTIFDTIRAEARKIEKLWGVER